MSRMTFLLIAGAYYILTILVIVIVLNVINSKEKKKLRKEITGLEKERNLIISASMLSELNKVEALANNEELKIKYNEWQERFKKIKETEIPKITDTINEIDELFENKNYKELKGLILKADFDLNNLKTKADFLLDEIKDITLSEERNREVITKLKASYRAIKSEYMDNIIDFEIVKVPIELQFENVDKLFIAFEVTMEQNKYTEVGKIVKAIDDIIANLKEVIEETIDGYYVGILEIPKISLSRGFVSQNSLDNDVSKNVSIVPTSDMPNITKGNFILAAHSGDSYISYFKDLYQLEIGDYAYVTYQGTKYAYKITNIYLQNKTGTIGIYKNYKKTTLTLVTCTKDDELHQTIYIAELISVN
ncbi:MAG: septation ring formation regulator EzrA [Bacilli bacterium]